MAKWIKASHKNWIDLDSIIAIHFDFDWDNRKKLERWFLKVFFKTRRDSSWDSMKYTYDSYEEYIECRKNLEAALQELNNA